MLRVLIRVLSALLATSALSQTLAFDLNDNAVKELAPPGSRAIVLFFAASDCPISNRYVPEIQRLAEVFAAQKVRVWFVYPNPSDNADVIRSHNSYFAIRADTALDTKQTLVRMAHVAVTPEAAVFVPEAGGLREVYHGRIDDRYIALGKERPTAMHHDLEDVIRAVLSHKTVPQSQGSPVGCAIVPLQP